MKLAKTDREKLLRRQKYRCNNTPSSRILGLEKFVCPKWTYECNGRIKENEYEIVKRDPKKRSTISNLQLLCMACCIHKRESFHIPSYFVYVVNCGGDESSQPEKIEK